MTGEPRALKLCLFGAAPDTGNLGVSALCYGTLAALARTCPEADVTVFDFGRGVRAGRLAGAQGTQEFRCIGGYLTRRLYRRESFWNMKWSARLGGLGSAGVRAMREADAILDISGGDSFADLYGDKRFHGVAASKLLALEMGKRLILLPQTYGPYRSPRFREMARRIVCGAAGGGGMAWARDERSFAALRELAGSDFDPARHCCGVDVAFGMEAVEPDAPLPEDLRGWLEKRREPVAGLNISGLIYNDPEAGQRYGLKADYRLVIKRLIEGLVKESDARALLVPHVVTPAGHYESDIEACGRVAEMLGDGAKGRVAVLPAMHDPRHAKWVIARLDWFCGTRMHSTIAGLSSGVATAAIAYSLKTQGVFETCGQGAHVADPRVLGTAEMAEHLMESWRQRVTTRESLAAALPAVLRQAEEQMARIATCSTEAERRAPDLAAAV